MCRHAWILSVAIVCFEIAQADLKVPKYPGYNLDSLVLLPLPPKFWGYKHVPLLFCFEARKYFVAQAMLEPSDIPLPQPPKCPDHRWIPGRPASYPWVQACHRPPGGTLDSQPLTQGRISPGERFSLVQSGAAGEQRLPAETQARQGGLELADTSKTRPPLPAQP